ncbi:MAG TPA: type II toxin-antitoxin system antitoxin SocA domain-containing protein [Chryseolinea sp.]
MLGSTSPKTKELILYVAKRLDSKHNYGVTLLYKTLYFIDNISYLKRGKAISEFTYVKQAFGPTPEPRQFLSLRDVMVGSGEIEIKKAGFLV